MTEIIEERRTAQTDQDFVVFLIGMRVNKPLKVHRWLPVAMSMNRMINELQQLPTAGLLNYESWFGRTSIMVQYWRSFDALEQYAKQADLKHRPAWADFNRKVNSNGDVGIWHETYTVSPGQFEVVYNNMPNFGLAKATSSIPATGQRKNAKERMRAA